MREAKYFETVRTLLKLLVTIGMFVALMPVIDGVASNELANASQACRAPRIVGLTVASARRQATEANCQLELRGASVRLPDIQLVERQAPQSGTLTKVLSGTVEALCPSTSNIGPPPGEPLRRPGPH